MSSSLRSWGGVAYSLAPLLGVNQRQGAGLCHGQMRLSKPLESGYSRYGTIVSRQAVCFMPSAVALCCPATWAMNSTMTGGHFPILGSGAGSLESVRGVRSARFWVRGHFHQDVCMTSSCSFGAWKWGPWWVVLELLVDLGCCWWGDSFDLKNMGMAQGLRHESTKRKLMYVVWPRKFSDRRYKTKPETVSINIQQQFSDVFFDRVTPRDRPLNVNWNLTRHWSSVQLNAWSMRGSRNMGYIRKHCASSLSDA